MKIVCTQENLKTGLGIVSRVVGSSSTLPILNNVLLQTENGQLKISGTNLEVGMSTFIRCKIEQEGGVCLTAKTLLDLINNLPNENITMEVGDGETSITTDRYHTKVKHLPVEDFPLIPKVDNGIELTVPAGTLKSGIDQTAFAASTSETQPEISGIMILLGTHNLVLAATDRYRLAEMQLPITSPKEKKIIIPHRSIQELSRLLPVSDDLLSLQASDTQLAITVGDTYLVTRLIDGQYPDYQQIIPSETGNIISVDRAQLSAAMKTSGIFSRGSGSVTIAFDSEKQIIQISSSSHEVGESLVDVPAEINGESGSVIMNYRYVLDVLQNVTAETLAIQIIDDSNPVVFKPKGVEGYLYLVMPIRL